MKCILRDYNTFVTSTFDLRLLVESCKYPKIPLWRMCEIFLNVELDTDTNAAYVDIELFKLFAEQLQPKKPNDDQIHVCHIVDDSIHVRC